MNRMILISLLLLGLMPVFAQESTVKSLDFRVENGKSLLDIMVDGPIGIDQTVNDQDNQIVIELNGATLGSMASRNLDTSSFDSPVQMVSPYEIQEDGQVRIVIQMKEKVEADITQSEGKISVALMRSGAATTSTRVGGKSTSPPPVPDDAPMDEVDSSSQVPKQAAASTPPVPPANAPNAAINANLRQGPVTLENLQTSLASKNFVGKKISIQVRDAEVVDVFRLISEASGFNVILGPNVSGKISLSLVDVPWDQALDVVLNTLKLGAERNNNILRVMTLENFTSEKRAQLAAERAAQEAAPRITRVFPISYSNPDELSRLLIEFGRKGNESSQTGIVRVDQRTNSIIVQDIAENIERMTKLIEILDTQTPQVLVEAKVIEATEDFSRAASGSLGFGAEDAGFGQYFFSAAGGNPLGELVSGDAGSVFADGGSIATATGTPLSGGIGFSPTVSFIPGVERLNAILNFAETERKIRVVSAPKTVVLSQQTANILQTTPVAVPVTTIADGTPINSFEINDANLSLNVTPTVTNDEGVMLQLEVQKDVPQDAGGTSAVARRNMNTNVLVENGSTLVIGGIYSADTSEASSGFPVLKDIPIIGILFGSKSKVVQRTELFIFVTPRVLNAAKAGFET